MRIGIHTRLHYHFEKPTDVLLQIEAAATAEQHVEEARLDLTECVHFAKVAAQDGIGERFWVRTEGLLELDYSAAVEVRRPVLDIATLPAMPPHRCPGETVQYMLASRYCPSDQFEQFVEAEFDGLEGGAAIAAMRDYVAVNFTYTIGSSHSGTTALESFVMRQGVCRDYAHILITLARAAAIPARMASVYAPRVDPPDFHAVAEVFLDGAWHLIDASGMATGDEMAVIGIGRDAADIAFLTAYGFADLKYKDVAVTAV